MPQFWDKYENNPPHAAAVFSRAEKLDRLSRGNWFLAVVIIILTTLGLYAGVQSVLREKMAVFWPWAGTNLALIGSLSAVVLVFTTYLTIQQRQIGALRRQLRQIQRDTNARMQKHCDRLYALLTVSRVLGTSTDEQTVFDCITRTCLASFDCEQASLMLLDRASDELRVRSATGHIHPEKVEETRIKMGLGIAGWVAEHRRPVILGRTVDTELFQEFQPKDYELTAAMVVPIAVRGEFVGVLNVGRRTDGAAYGDEDLQAFMVFAENAGIACRHAEQAAWMRQTIQGLDTAIQEHRSPGEQAA